MNNNENMEEFLSNFSSGQKTPYDIMYPFDAISLMKINIDNIIVGILGPDLIQQKFDSKYIKFPKNITNVLWYKSGSPDYDPWYAIVKIKYKKITLVRFF